MTRPVHWKTRSRVLPLQRTLIMGILNVTPDSFSDGGSYDDPTAAVEAAYRMVEAGAALIDVGGESTRPGALPVPEAEELARVLPVVTELAASGLAVSIDTSKPGVAAAALEAGAEVVNDVTGLRDPKMRRLVAEAEAGAVIMHMRGEPRTMQQDPHYDDVVAEVEGFLLAQASLAESEGVAAESIVIDPGIGFGKTVDHNLELLRHLDRLASHGYPVLVGTSRKSFLSSITGLSDPTALDHATAVTVALTIERGASIVRVHNVPLARESALVAEAMVGDIPWHR